jgi:hypothetical protein
VRSLERNPTNIKFNENPVTSLRVVTCGKAGMVTTTDVFVQHAVVKAPKHCNKIGRTVQQREWPLTNGANTGLFNWLLSSSSVIALSQQLLILSGDAVNVYL